MASAGGPPDPQECLLRSGVRSGLKREFAFALRSQAQLSASLGRTRSAKSSVASAAPVRRDIKKTKKSSLPPKDVVVVVDCDEKPVVDIVPSANEGTRETLAVVESRGDSVESMKTSITVELGDEVMVDFVPSINTAAGETLASFDGCGESALVTALPLEEPSKVSAIVDCHDEPKMDAVTSKSGDVMKTHASVDYHGEFAVEVAPRLSKPIKVFVRSRLRGKVGGLMKCPNRGVDTLGSTIDTAIVLDDDSSCKSNGSLLDDSNPMENFVTIDCDDELNVDDSPSKNPSKSSATFRVDDTVQGFLHECAAPTLIIDGIRPLQGISTIVDYQDGILVEGNQPELTIMENVQGICKSDSKFPGQASRRLTRSSIKVKEENSGPEVGAGTSCESIPSEGTIDRAMSLKGSSGSDIGAGISSESIGSEGAIGLANSIKGSLGSTPTNNMELKMSKKISLKKLPNNVRELLSTGLLEGFPVKYYAPTRKQCELQGFIKGNGILCSCATCDCSTVVSAYIFELHAGSTKKHPADFILLQNGNSLHDVVKACRVAPLDMLEAVIQGAIGPVPPKKCFTCHKCNVFFSTSRTGKFALLCDSCLESKQVQTPNSLIQNASSARLTRTSSTLEPSARTISVIEPSTNTSSILEPLIRTSSVLEPSTRASSMLEPLTRTSSILEPSTRTSSILEPSTRTSSELEPSNGSLKSFSLNNSNKKSSQGRLTRKDLGLHKLVFMNGILPEGTEVGYYVRGKKLLEGYIKDSGIYCQCCNTVVSPSQFEAHAGRAARRKPYNNIYTSNGVSLHELSVSLSKDRKLSATENDDLCSICADGGNLLLCDLCPRAFHPECVGLRIPPEGDWYCQYCHNLHQRERSVACNDNAIAAGRVAGVDPIEQIFQKSIRTVTTSLCDVGGCAVCRSHDFSKSKFDDRTVMICDQCEKEYHVGCLREEKMADLKELPEGEWFCCTDCSRIWTTLQELILRGAQLLPAFNADVIRTKMKNKGVNRDSDVDVRWRLLSGKTSAADSKLLLSRAVAIFHESFDPIIDATTGRDLIPSMVYGRTVRDQDFGGMICAVLVVGSSVVSAGILRVMGTEVAELPLVATSRENQGLGYFQSLYSCIETLLGSLNVKNFLLPAAEEAESIWTTKFGFTKINSDQLQKILKGARTTVFQGTSMLHKPVPLQVSSQEVQATEGRQ